MQKKLLPVWSTSSIGKSASPTSLAKRSSAVLRVLLCPTGSLVFFRGPSEFLTKFIKRTDKYDELVQSPLNVYIKSTGKEPAEMIFWVGRGTQLRLLGVSLNVICSHPCIHICTGVYIYIYVHMCVYTYKLRDTNTCVHTNMGVYIYTHTHMHCLQKYVHAYIQTYTYVHVRPSTYTGIPT